MFASLKATLDGKGSIGIERVRGNRARVYLPLLRPDPVEDVTKRGGRAVLASWRKDE